MRSHGALFQQLQDGSAIHTGVGSSEEGLPREASQDSAQVAAQIQALLVVPDRGRKVLVVGSATVSDFPVRTLF